MPEFVLKSRKNETDTHDFEVEKLQKPVKEQSLEFLESKVRGLRPAKKLDALPWQLERLVRAAASNLLPTDMVSLTSGLVPDLNRYVLAWGCSYLTGDRDEALGRLRQAHQVWSAYPCGAHKDVN